MHVKSKWYCIRAIFYWRNIVVNLLPRGLSGHSPCWPILMMTCDLSGVCIETYYVAKFALHHACMRHILENALYRARTVLGLVVVFASRSKDISV